MIEIGTPTAQRTMDFMAFLLLMHRDGLKTS